jgi:hypothetical protein
MLTLAEIATGGAAATGVSLALTQEVKRLVELRWGPKAPAHDTIVEAGGLLVSILVVLVATLATTAASPGSSPWWHAIMVAIMAGIGIKYASSGLYGRLTAGKADGDLVAELGQLATVVAGLQAPAVPAPTPAPAETVTSPAAIAHEQP